MSREGMLGSEGRADVTETQLPWMNEHLTDIASSSDAKLCWSGMQPPATSMREECTGYIGQSGPALLQEFRFNKQINKQNTQVF